MTAKITRRELIQKSLFSFGALSLSAGFTGCNDSSDRESTTLQVSFEHGVASGDPLQDRVILWTRLTPKDSSARLEVVWEIASDDQFKQIIKTDKVSTAKAQDFTVKVDVTNLKPDQTIFIVLALVMNFHQLDKPKHYQSTQAKSVLRYVHVRIIQQAIFMSTVRWQSKMSMR